MAFQNKLTAAQPIEFTAFAFGGRTVGRRADGKVCFVRGLVPGELAEINITAEKKKYSEGELCKILRRSPDRIQAECPNLCPGCSYLHIPYSMELAWKQQQFHSFAERAHLKAQPDDFICDPVGCEVRTQWRNKIRLSLDFSENGIVKAGYHGEDNISLIEVQDCPSAVAEIREVLHSGAWKNDLTGNEKNVTFRWTKQNGVHYFFDNCGRQLITDELSGFGDFIVSESSFFQVNPFMSGKLAERVCSLVKELPVQLLVELYCGCGCYSILCAERNNYLRYLGIELDPEAVRCAAVNAERHQVQKQGIFLAGDSAKMFKKQYPHGLPAGSLLLVDPPRTGLDAAALSLAGSSHADYMIYISCSPDTLFRDLPQLEQYGWNIRQSGLLDMFPATAHFETVTLLERKG